MATFGSYAEYDEFLALMADAQRYKLKLNKHKGFLGDCPPAVLLAKLREEVDELEEAASRGSAFDMILESADIANFALGFVISALKQQRVMRNAGTGTPGTDIRSEMERPSPQSDPERSGT